MRDVTAAPTSQSPSTASSPSPKMYQLEYLFHHLRPFYDGGVYGNVPPKSHGPKQAFLTWEEKLKGGGHGEDEGCVDDDAKDVGESHETRIGSMIELLLLLSFRTFRAVICAYLL